MEALVHDGPRGEYAGDEGGIPHSRPRPPGPCRPRRRLRQRIKNALPELGWRLNVLELLECCAEALEILAQDPEVRIGQHATGELTALLPVELAIDLGVNE